LYLHDEIHTLRMVELFSDFDHDQLNLIAFTSKKLNFLPDAEIFHEGQSASGGYAIMSGSVDLVHNQDFDKIHLGTYNEGSILSELSLITPNRRRATAIAKTEATLLSIPRSVMLRILTEYPHLAAGIRAKIQRSLTGFVHDIEDMPRKLNQNQIEQ